MRYFLILPLLLGLSACASPTFNMSDAQIRALSDDQLCSFHNNYRAEARAEAEIAARGLNCDRFYRECLARGNKPNTQAMDFCMDILRQNERLRYESDFDDFGYFGHRGLRSGAGVGFGF